MQKQYTFEWVIERFERADQLHGLENVVTKAFFTIIGKDNLGNSAPFYGYVDFPPPKAGEFTAFESITPEEALQWIEEQLDEDAITAITDRLIVQLNQDDMLQAGNKTVATPWSQTPQN
jgi:hypothetical protein